MYANSNIAVIVEDTYVSRRLLKPKEWMKETWGKRVTVWQVQVEFCSCTISDGCVIPEILLTHFVCLNFNIKDTFHFSLPTSLSVVYHCSFVHLNINWNAAKITMFKYS